MKYTFLTITCVVVLATLIPAVLLAATAPSLTHLKNSLDVTAGGAGISTAASNADISIKLGQAINFIFGIIGSLFLVIIIAGGIGWMTAGGNQDKVSKGRQFIVGGITGMLIIFMAYALVYVVLQALQLGAAGAA